MAQFIEIHPQNPQSRLIYQVVKIVRQGGVIVYPTDSGYALGCRVGEKQPLDTIKRIRKLDDKHNFSLVCKSLAQSSSFAKLSNDAHRLIKTLTPGPFTFIADATKEVPRRMMHAKRKTIGIRIPDNNIALAIVEELGEPLLSASLILPGEEYALSDPFEIRESLENELDLIIDAGIVNGENSTIISCADNQVSIVRQGVGVASMLEN
ncbi:L-threonylcarbamoyladenylate synthase [Methyloprofundus sp.]|uniref:L-threonylcarbamoyladenylate synthase n=1 Tax=Methyloprofundus sp. TaxID=2020875 RepID=UPI003D09C719